MSALNIEPPKTLVSRLADRPIPQQNPSDEIENTLIKIHRAEDNLRRQLDWIEKIQGRTQSLLTSHLAIVMIFVTIFVVTAQPSPDGTADVLAELSILEIILIVATAIIATLPLIIISKILIPTLQVKNNKKTSLNYFHHISLLECDDFLKYWQNQNTDEYVEDLIRQAWVNAKISSEKIHDLRYAIYASMSSWLVFLVGLIWSFIS